MDASDTGLCALHSARREHIRLKFDEDERLLILQGQFSINIREQLGAVLAILCWGRDWSRRVFVEVTHIRCWIDNRSAVAWCNNLNSRDPLAQELNRVLGAIEAQWALHVSAKHLPGAVNTMADLGSRAWDGPRLTNWRSLTKAWTQVPISNAIRKIYSAKWSAFNSAPSRKHPDASTKEPGSSGKHFVRASECQDGFHKTTRKHNPYYWLSSPFTAGPEEINTAEPLQAPFNLNYAISAGIIGHLPDLNLDFDQTTPSPLLECVGRAQQRDDEEPSRDQCCNGLSANSTSKTPAPRAALLGYFFLLRSAEYLAVKGRRRVYTLQVRDLNFQDELGCQSTSPLRAVIFAARLLMDNATRLQLQPEEPICSIKASTMLSAEIMSKVLQSAAKATGEDATLFSCHSLRRGGATALLSAGVDSTAVMLHGRWKSDSYQRYTSYTNESGRHLAERMAFGGSNTSQQSRHDGKTLFPED
ncbi:hypothetical protein PHMEG_00034828, partial [Phytophthora megakarya]